MRAAIAFGVVVGLVSAAHADQADALFKKAKRLLAEKKYAEACAAFEQVDHLDPAIGAKLSVGKCYEEWGRLAVAYRWYLDAEAMATAVKDDRAAKIRAVAEELDSNVPRVTLKLPEGADPAIVATVTFDGKPVDPATFGLEQRVDPGPHTVEFVVDRQTKKKMAPVERGGGSEIMLDIPKGTQGKRGVPDPTPVVDTPPVRGHRQRIAGIVIGASGVVAVGIASGITLSARRTYKDALAAHCMGSSSMCDPAGLTATHDARHTANIATVVAVIGGAAVIGGVVLYLTAPRPGSKRGGEHALYFSPVIGSDGASVVLGGSI